MPSDNIHYVNSRCRVVINCHPREGQDVTSYFSAAGDQQEIINCTVAKNPNDPCGSFAFDIVPLTQDWLKIIRPDDWVEIYMTNGDAGSAEELVMVGLVDTIRRTRNVTEPATGATMTTISVAGRDCGKVLLETDPFLDPKLNLSIQGIPFMNSAPPETKNSFAFTADSMVKRILDVYFDPNKGVSEISDQFSKPDGTPFYKRDGTGVLQLDMFLDTLVHNEFLVILASLPNLSQSMWSFMEQYANRLFNQFFIEMLPNTANPKGPLKPTLYMREFPYIAGRLMALEDFKLDRNETSSDNFGLSSHEIKNWFRVDSSIFNNEAGQGSNIGAITKLGYINRESIKKHGLKRLDQESMYGQLSASNSSSLDSITKMTDLIANWHWNSEALLNGTIVSRLRPDIRLTKRIDYSDGGEVTAFINEGYTHQWVYQGMATTTINVSRGVLKSKIRDILLNLNDLTDRGILTKIADYNKTRRQQAGDVPATVG